MSSVREACSVQHPALIARPVVTVFLALFRLFFCIDLIGQLFFLVRLGILVWLIRRFKESFSEAEAAKLARKNKAKFYLHSVFAPSRRKSPLLYPSFPRQSFPIDFQNVHMSRE
jgi:hypothetical protein